MNLVGYAYDTMVNTTEGIVTIEEIVNYSGNVYVNTHLGHKRVLSKSRVISTDNYLVTTTDGYSIKVTKNCLFAQLVGGRLVTKSIDNINSSSSKSLLMYNPSESNTECNWTNSAKMSYLIGVFTGSGVWVGYYPGEKKLLRLKFPTSSKGFSCLNRVSRFITDIDSGANVNLELLDNHLELSVISNTLIDTWMTLEDTTITNRGIPREILLSNSNIHLAYIAGLIDSTNFIFTDIKLMNDVRLLLLSLGIRSNIVYNADYNTYVVKLSGETVSILEKYVVQLESIVTETLGKTIGNVYSTAIKSIVTYGSVDMYNITVERGLFSANGFYIGDLTVKL